ncbi:LamG-like jellyroll fold domain-containing protein [Streptomyces sp. NPDC008313]|uniref:LamG-like jellyroll fold domain-containing protein n=1 Tax=Streptomyces sp. NPDC008313 TaxID=3364826 RepID=UPI0036E2FDB5
MVTAVAVVASLVSALGVSAESAYANEANADSAQSASVRAAATGEPVEVTSERTAYTQTVANPDGTYTLTQSTTPQRAKADDGSWRNVDATLESRPDGTVGPKAAVVDLAFSDGGRGDGFISIGNERGALALGWPGTLPKPTLRGATATYAEVLDGVDLELTATAEGYREVLVVKSAQAAANPELEQVELTVTGKGLQVLPGRGGGLRAVDEDGNTVFNGPAGLMWDSSGDEKPAQSAPSASAISGSATSGKTAETAPGVGDATAEMPVKVGRGTITVKPNAKLLRGKGTVYPVRIDPSVGLDVSERSVLSNDGDRWWQFDGDYGVGNCSRLGPYYCDKDHTNRMYFEFGASKLSGKQVIDATFRAKETWSFTCDAKWVDLERTNNISEGTRWPGPSQLDQMGDRYVSAGRGDLCSPDQPDSWIEFNDNPDEPDENLTSSVRNLASGKFSRLTLMLRAKDEGDPAAWKRFDDNAELQVVYVPKPGVPSSVGLIPGDGTTAYCNKSSSDPLIVTRFDPMAQARVQTQVKPKSGEEKGELQAEFVVQRGDDAAWHQVWSDYRPKPGWNPDDTLEKVRMTNRADGGLYRMHARTQSHWSYGSKSGDLWSSYSSWCYFKIDSTAPKAPQIATTGVYTECTADLCEGKGGPGVAGSFQLKPNAADTDITAYRWRLLTQKSTTTTTGSTVAVKPVPSLSGTQVLTVQAKDVRNRWGDPAEFVFKVANASGAVGTWHFADGTPSSTATTAKDSATEGTRHDVTLHPLADGTGATWSGLGRRGTGDYSLRLNGDVTDAARRTAYASTADPAVNTGDSFTISAWVLLTDGSTNRVVAAAPGTNGSAFTLYYSSTYEKWVFNRTAGDVPFSPVYIRSMADTADPVRNVWTHLAGVFDSKGDTDRTNDTIQLFVNGRAQGQPVKAYAASTAYIPWVSTEGLQIGRSKVAGAYGENFMGRVDELNLWQRALTADEVRQAARLESDLTQAAELVAYWDTASATDGKVAEYTPYPVDSMDISSTGAVADPDDNELRLDGASGYMSATGPTVDETGSFTVTADVKLDGAKFAAMPVGGRAQVFGQSTPDGKESSWALWVEKVSDDGYLWRFGRTATDSAGKVLASVQVSSVESAEMDTWVQVTGVYDATEDVGTGYGSTHLYIGETEQDQEDGGAFAAIQQGGGEIAAGRGRAGGTTGYYLPGSLDEARVWAGAMNGDQVRSLVLGASDDE